VQANGLVPLVVATTTGTLTVGGRRRHGRSVGLQRTGVADTITINATTVAHTGYKTITYDATVESRQVNGGLGDDTISATAAAVAWRISGGDGNTTLTGSGVADLILGDDGMTRYRRHR